ncbi:galactosyltransferase1 [Wolffia australiana]
MRRCLMITGMACLLVVLIPCYVSLSFWAQRSISPALLRNRLDPLGRSRETHEAPPAKPLIPTQEIVSALFSKRNFSSSESRSLETWNRFRDLVFRSAPGLPNGAEAVNEAVFAWAELAREIFAEKEKEKEKEKERENGTPKTKENQCPYSIRKMDAAAVNGSSSFKMKIPCGLVQGSSVTVIGTPVGLLGEFKIELVGAALPGDPDPPIVLHVDVRLMGDKHTEEPVIVQNTWTQADDWGDEERCPNPLSEGEKVDGLDKCSGMVGKEETAMATPRVASGSSKQVPFFPFRLRRLAVTTLRVGAEGFQMAVDGKHVSSFAYRERLEPWLVNAVRISGEFRPISVLVGGLPTSEDFEHVVDLASLQSPVLPPRQPLALFVGVVSAANNFKRRMAIRRSWMQYDLVRSGRVAVRFFVGLHKNRLVNEELWNEARSYGDLQLLPFVDYYSLISLKTIAICIYGTEVVVADFVMKTDDDSFVRVDEILDTLTRFNVTQGLLYGRVKVDSEPHRDPDSKWYITQEEWPEEKYPPWAHGPGYVVSGDVAQFVRRWHRSGRRKMFKLEDVSMGIWVAEMAKEGVTVQYVNEERINVEGCEAGYVVAHYQGPRDMLCLWRTLNETHIPTCCAKR